MNYRITPDLLAEIAQQNLETFQLADPSGEIDMSAASELGALTPDKAAELPIVDGAEIVDPYPAGDVDPIAALRKVVPIDSDRIEDYESFREIQSRNHPTRHRRRGTRPLTAAQKAARDHEIQAHRQRLDLV